MDHAHQPGDPQEQGPAGEHTKSESKIHTSPESLAMVQVIPASPQHSLLSAPASGQLTMTSQPQTTSPEAQCVKEKVTPKKLVRPPQLSLSPLSALTTSHPIRRKESFNRDDVPLSPNSLSSHQSSIAASPGSPLLSPSIRARRKPALNQLTISTSSTSLVANDEDARDDTWSASQMDSLFETAMRIRLNSVSSCASQDAEEELERALRRHTQPQSKDKPAPQ